MNHKARKRFGQNFLQDMGVIERMLNALDPARDDLVLEVGPGLGALTLPLLERLNRLTVAEIDRDLIARLESLNHPHLHVRAGDVMQLDLASLFIDSDSAHPTDTGDVFGNHDPQITTSSVESSDKGKTGNTEVSGSTNCTSDDMTSTNSAASSHRLRVVGNLPYNIGTPLLMRLLEQERLIRDIHVMLQKEVVDRLHAEPGTRAFGRLSVLMQSVFHVTPLFTVPPQAFDPAPKVQSAVVRLKPRSDAPDARQIAALQACTRLAFASKRKTLRNNFKGHLDDNALRSLNIDPQARAETLDLAAFHRLAKRLGQV